MRHSPAIASALLVIVLGAGALFTPVRLATVVTSDGETLVCTPVTRASTITLVFQHSMYGGDVRETFRPAADDGLLRTRVVTSNAAAAEYYATDGRVMRTEDGFEVVVAPMPLAALPFVIDRIGRHVLLIDGASVDLYAAAGATTTARLTIESRSGFASLLAAIGAGGVC